MLRVVLVVILVFFLLTVLRGLRIFLAAFLRPTSSGAAQRQGAVRDGEMVRDPVCGTWIDRRLAVIGRQGGQPVPVCSEQCRTRLEAS